MLDPTSTLTSFVTTDVPTSQGVQFRPHIRRWVTHVSPENIDCTVWAWTRNGESVHRIVSLSEANEMAQMCRDNGWREERWVWSALSR